MTTQKPTDIITCAALVFCAAFAAGGILFAVPAAALIAAALTGKAAAEKAHPGRVWFIVPFFMAAGVGLGFWAYKNGELAGAANFFELRRSAAADELFLPFDNAAPPAGAVVSSACAFAVGAALALTVTALSAVIASLSAAYCSLTGSFGLLSAVSIGAAAALVLAGTKREKLLPAAAGAAGAAALFFLSPHALAEPKNSAPEILSDRPVYIRLEPGADLDLDSYRSVSAQLSALYSADLYPALQYSSLSDKGSASVTLRFSGSPVPVSCYGLVTTDGARLLKNSFGSSLAPKGIEMTLYYDPDYLEKPFILAETLDISADVEYLKREALYRSAVEMMYGSVSDSELAALRRDFDIPDSSSGVDEKLEIIRQYVRGSLSDGFNSVPSDLIKGAGSDEERCARLAVICARSSGISARVVRGWFVSEGNTREHTWAEIYLDRLGWLPFEIIPDYGADILAELPVHEREGGGSGEADGRSPAAPEEKPPAAQELPDTESQSRSSRSLLLPVIIAAVIAAAALIYALRVRIALALLPERRAALFLHRRCVSLMDRRFGTAELLPEEKADKLTGELKDKFIRSRRAYEELLFAKNGSAGEALKAAKELYPALKRGRSR